MLFDYFNTAIHTQPLTISSQIRQGISVEAKGTAYVVFWNVMDAKNALEKLNGYNFQNRYLVGTFIPVITRQPFCSLSDIYCSSVASTREDPPVKR